MTKMMTTCKTEMEHRVSLGTLLASDSLPGVLASFLESLLPPQQQLVCALVAFFEVGFASLVH